MFCFLLRCFVFVCVLCVVSLTLRCLLPRVACVLLLPCSACLPSLSSPCSPTLSHSCLTRVSHSFLRPRQGRAWLGYLILGVQTPTALRSPELVCFVFECVIPYWRTPLFLFCGFFSPGCAPRAAWLRGPLHGMPGRPRVGLGGRLCWVVTGWVWWFVLPPWVATSPPPSPTVPVACPCLAVTPSHCKRCCPLPESVRLVLVCVGV